jgi:hypothetical protein
MGAIDLCEQSLKPFAYPASAPNEYPTIPQKIHKARKIRTTSFLILLFSFSVIDIPHLTSGKI